MKPEFDIIIPSYGQPDLTMKCLFSVYDHSPQNARVIWIDNSPTDSPTYAMQSHRTFYLKMTENIGYTRAINAGIAISTAPYAVFLNTDTIVEENWLEKLKEPFAKIRKLAAVGPVTNNEGQGQGRTHRYPKNTGVIELEPRFNVGWGIDVRITFFCIMICREALLDVGYMDDRFSPGCGEDDDWLVRAHLKGWKMAVNTDVCIQHVGKASWDPTERIKRQEFAHAYLKKKYSQWLQPS